MNIAFRTDASVEMGTGHIMRCLTLAGELREKGVKVSFICRLLPGNLCNFIENKNYRVYRLPFEQSPLRHYMNTRHAQWLGVAWETDAEQTKEILEKEEENIDWLVVDHYALDSRWESQIRPYVNRIMVIDDLADRPHNCDLLLDQNLYANMDTRYDGLVPNHCQKLLGPKNALLRPEFREARKKLRQRDGIVKRILIFFGGSDPTNETAKALRAIQLINRPNINVDVVVGGANPHKETIERLCSFMTNTNFYYQVDNMAELMANSDLMIGAGGTTTWERFFLGLPSITIIIAHNQAETIKTLGKASLTWNLGWYENVTVAYLSDIINKAINSPDILKIMGENAMQLMGSKQYDSKASIFNVLMGGNNVTA